MDKLLLTEARTTRRAFAGIVLFSFLAGLLIILQAALLSRIINHLFLDSWSRAAATPLFLWLIGVIALRAGNQFFLTNAATAVAARVKTSLRRQVVDNLITGGPNSLQFEQSGELSTTVTDGIDSLDSYFAEYLPALFSAALIPLAILLVVLPVDGLTFLVFLLTAPLIPIFMILIGRGAGALAASRYRQLEQLSAHFLDVMQGLYTLKLFNRSKAQTEIIARISDQYRETTLAVLRLAFLSAFTLELVATISVAVVAVEIGLKLLFGRMIFVDALFLLVLAPEFYQPLRQLGAKFHAGRDGTAVAERLAPLLQIISPTPVGTDPVPAYSDLIFKNVSVAFANGDRPALHDFSLTIPRGSRIALVGTTGSGKSTIANLLLRFLTPDSGQILLSTSAGVVPLGNIDPAAWRARLSWVPQRGYLFNRSAAENIRLSAPQATEDAVREAAAAAAAQQFIQHLPRGYETLLGENGSRLSGGQAQRIVLARAFLRTADLYIFDEATANLDPENEGFIQQTIARLPSHVTIITIAHHLSTIQAADRIIVLDNGRIAETGTHAALLQRQGAYFTLLQALGIEQNG
jgi:ATP-binding cassette subfamily C protein CydD